MNKLHFVFVYGSLRKNMSNHDLLGDSSLIGYFDTEPKYTMVSEVYFPHLYTGGDTSIKGEVYLVTDEVLKDLDVLEGHPNYYKRELMSTLWGEAWIYLVNKGGFSKETVVVSGDWVKYRRSLGK